MGTTRTVSISWQDISSKSKKGVWRHPAIPRSIADLGSALTWDGHRLPGHWLVKQAISEARSRVLAHPVVTVTIGRGHHIGCLQAYLKPVTDAGLIILLMCSDPSSAGVTPHGGVASRISPNPIAAGFPTGGDPILIDISTSTTTNAMNKRRAASGERLPGAWLTDADGRPSDDPRVLSGNRPGATLPLGGLELGHRGFALALIVEALTSGLSGSWTVRSRRHHGPRRSFFRSSILMRVGERMHSFVRCSFSRTHAARHPSLREIPQFVSQGNVRSRTEDGSFVRALCCTRRSCRALAPWAERFGIALPQAIQV